MEMLKAPRIRTAAAVTAGTACIGFAYVNWRRSQKRSLKRPFVIKDIAAGEEVNDPEAELTQIVSWLQDSVVRPIDERLPGKPFAHDLLDFPFTPMVLVVGNHSAGKSTFINDLLGIKMQETGVAPTDDGFTVLQRGDRDEVEDGPTLLSCPENRPFKELQRFGQPFWGHFRRKRLVLPKGTSMPYGLQIVDTPGMIDMPIKTEHMAGGRGYNFIEVVRWFAKRADLILLLFDPDRPGTTGESLEVLTRSLCGLDHKFAIILNKVDQLDSSVDFARAYGTLGWALSKVIPRKDIPLIYTMFNEGAESDGNVPLREHKLPLEAFRKKRKEVVAEVLRAKSRHWDNVITSTEDTMRQLQMVAKVAGAVQQRTRSQYKEAAIWGFVALATPAVLAAKLFHEKWMGTRLVPVAFWTAYAGITYGIGRLLREYCLQFERLQVADLDSYFEESYAWYFIHVDAEDLRVRWAGVRPRVASILRAASKSLATLPRIPSWEIDRIDECLEKDVWYLRLLAKRMRETDPTPKVSSCTHMAGSNGKEAK